MRFSAERSQLVNLLLSTVNRTVSGPCGLEFCLRVRRYKFRRANGDDSVKKQVPEVAQKMMCNTPSGK